MYIKLLLCFVIINSLKCYLNCGKNNVKCFADYFGKPEIIHIIITSVLYVTLKVNVMPHIFNENAKLARYTTQQNYKKNACPAGSLMRVILCVCTFARSREFHQEQEHVCWGITITFPQGVPLRSFLCGADATLTYNYVYVLCCCVI